MSNQNNNSNNSNNNNTIRSALKGEVTCAVCHDVYDQPQALIPCLHTFCLECINFIPNRSGNIVTCPICRSTSTNYVFNFAVKNLVDIFNNPSLKEAETIVIYRDQEVNTNSTNQLRRESDSSSSEAVRIIESIDIRDNNLNYEDITYENVESSSTTSSYRSAINSSIRIRPCRSCTSRRRDFQCPVPITSSNQSDFGHILCEFCFEYMPARGKQGIEPALDQCCSFCGIVACSSYWECSNTHPNAKLYKLNEINCIPDWLEDIDSIIILDEGHLNTKEIQSLKAFISRSRTSWRDAWDSCLKDIDENHYITPIFKRMVPAAIEVYNTRRLPKYFISYDISDSETDEEEDYFDQMSERGVQPSHHLRACVNCLPTIVNGQFYGYWKAVIEHNLARYTKQKCRDGITCDTQWTDEAHAERFSHIESEQPNSPF